MTVYDGGLLGALVHDPPGHTMTSSSWFAWFLSPLGMLVTVIFHNVEKGEVVQERGLVLRCCSASMSLTSLSMQEKFFQMCEFILSQALSAKWLFFWVVLLHPSVESTHPQVWWCTHKVVYWPLVWGPVLSYTSQHHGKFWQIFWSICTYYHGRGKVFKNIANLFFCFPQNILPQTILTKNRILQEWTDSQSLLVYRNMAYREV